MTHPLNITHAWLTERIRPLGPLPTGNGIILFGVRNLAGRPDQWCDLLGWYSQFDFRAYIGTTRPGAIALRQPMHPKGTAILKPGYYTNAYAIGLHRDNVEHPAFEQVGNMTAWRDNDRDAEFDKGPEDTGVFGWNLHRGNRNSLAAVVGPHSYGCQVIRAFAAMEALLDKARASNQRRFNYVLLEA